MNKIYSWAARILLAKLLPGSKTLLVAWAATIIGAYNILASTELLQTLCSNIHLCVEGSRAWGTFMMVFAEIVKLCRFATGQTEMDPKFIK